MDSASQKLTWAISKEKQQNIGPSLMEADWVGKIEPNYTSSGCMLMQADWEETQSQPYK